MTDGRVVPLNWDTFASLRIDNNSNRSFDLDLSPSSSPSSRRSSSSCNVSIGGDGNAVKVCVSNQNLCSSLKSSTARQLFQTNDDANNSAERTIPDFTDTPDQTTKHSRSNGDTSHQQLRKNCQECAQQQQLIYRLKEELEDVKEKDLKVRDCVKGLRHNLKSVLRENDELVGDLTRLIETCERTQNELDDTKRELMKVQRSNTRLQCRHREQRARLTNQKLSWRQERDYLLEKLRLSQAREAQLQHRLERFQGSEPLCDASTFATQEASAELSPGPLGVLDRDAAGSVICENIEDLSMPDFFFGQLSPSHQQLRRRSISDKGSISSSRRSISTRTSNSLSARTKKSMKSTGNITCSTSSITLSSCSTVTTDTPVPQHLALSNGLGDSLLEIPEAKRHGASPSRGCENVPLFEQVPKLLLGDAQDHEDEDSALLLPPLASCDDQNVGESKHSSRSSTPRLRRPSTKLLRTSQSSFENDSDCKEEVNTSLRNHLSSPESYDTDSSCNRLASTKKDEKVYCFGSQSPLNSPSNIKKSPLEEQKSGSGDEASCAHSEGTCDTPVPFPSSVPAVPNGLSLLGTCDGPPPQNDRLGNLLSMLPGRNNVYGDQDDDDEEEDDDQAQEEEPMKSGAMFGKCTVTKALDTKSPGICDKALDKECFAMDDRLSSEISPPVVLKEERRSIQENMGVVMTRPLPRILADGRYESDASTEISGGRSMSLSIGIFPPESGDENNSVDSEHDERQDNSPAPLRSEEAGMKQVGELSDSQIWGQEVLFSGDRRGKFVRGFSDRDLSVQDQNDQSNSSKSSSSDKRRMSMSSKSTSSSKSISRLQRVKRETSTDVVSLKRPSVRRNVGLALSTKLFATSANSTKVRNQEIITKAKTAVASARGYGHEIQISGPVRDAIGSNMPQDDITRAAQRTLVHKLLMESRNSSSIDPSGNSPPA